MLILSGFCWLSTGKQPFIPQIGPLVPFLLDGAAAIRYTGVKGRDIHENRTAYRPLAFGNNSDGPHSCPDTGVGRPAGSSGGGDAPLLGFRPDGTAVPLDLDAVLRFYGEDKDVRAQTAEAVYTVRERLYELEQRLAGLRFARVSHSEIVNLKRVTALDLSLTGTIRMTLTGGVTVYVSRRYVKKMKEVLGL